MQMPTLDPDVVEAHRKCVADRGLNSWPQDRPEDLRQIEHFAQWLAGLAEPARIRHPFFPLLLPVDRHFSARMAYYFAIGDYEQADLQLINDCVTLGDRVMECGAGAGVTGALAAAVSGNRVVVVEPNREVYTRVSATFAANRQTLLLVEGAVVPDAMTAESLELGVYSEYWWSSAIAPVKAERRLQVAALKLSALLAEHQPSVLILDIEGGEVGLFPATLPASLRLIMLEIHTPEIGELETVRLVNAIQAQGFELLRLLAQTWVFAKK